jgi:[ribosomal protein S5]-alanine N-acetyltransferase
VKPMARRAVRVMLRPPTARDGLEFCRLNRASRRLHRGLAAPPVTVAEFADYVSRCRQANFSGFLICRVADGALLGSINVSEIVRGRFHSAYLGYQIGQPFAGQGYMTEALQLALHVVFGSLRLHRVEANIQPRNVASLALVRRAGFRREGLSPRYLKIGGRWRDHERWALLVEEWRRRRRRAARARR